MDVVDECIKVYIFYYLDAVVYHRRQYSNSNFSNVHCVHKYVIAHLTINKSRETDYMPKHKQYYNAKLHLNM